MIGMMKLPILVLVAGLLSCGHPGPRDIERHEFCVELDDHVCWLKVDCRTSEARSCEWSASGNLPPSAFYWWCYEELRALGATDEGTLAECELAFTAMSCPELNAATQSQHEGIPEICSQ
jgi:hypothetical protein